MVAAHSVPLASAPSVPQGCQSVAAFPAPDQFDPGLCAFLERASEQLSRWLGSAALRAPLPLLSVLPDVMVSPAGRTGDELLADLQLVMDGAYNPNHPGALAHLDPPPLAASIAAELVCAGLNNNLLAEELSPSLSHLERLLCRWLAQRLGLPEGAGGVLASGGTLSNLMALVTARHRAGLAVEPRAVVLASEDAHVSLRKALGVMGLPADALVTVPVTGDGGLDPSALEELLQAQQRADRSVIAVVATAGTTVRGAVDPLPQIASLCRSRGIWLHIDGAIGAVFGLLETHRHRVEGLGLADSITVNPQKLLGISKCSSLLLLARPTALGSVFATGLPYMEPSWGGGHGGEWGLQGTRPGDVLKLWLGLRQLGLDGIAAVLDGAILRRRSLQQLLGEERLQVLAGRLHLLAFIPRDLDATAAARWSQNTRHQLLTQGLMLSRPLYAGRHHLKAVLGNPHTRPADLERLVAIVRGSLER